MNWHDWLKRAESYEPLPPNKILSLTLHTDRGSPAQQGGEWKIHLKNGLKKLREYEEAAGNGEESQVFASLAKQVEREIHQERRNLRKGIALFASSDRRLFLMKHLDVSVHTAFHYDEQAVTQPLRDMLESYPLTGIVLVQNERVRMIETQMGTVRFSQEYGWDLEAEDWHPYEGPHQGEPVQHARTHTQKDQYQDRYEAVQTRWYKRLAPRLDQQAKKSGWKRTVITGEPGQVQELSHFMSCPVTKIDHKNLGNKKDHEVVEMVTL
ncbi:VLRF1 family aeRF1-type release factor [Desmospora profundinema]|uniref:Uncharacterized protein n=1 Tax=Desmospora profundinema TaxID=1571184 RepID=A0ABU1IMB4_9BACL|nr:VLRF1 family aeRF1-type release factor [Desmospora profundinema]MDR6225911.1 hypothetical protein [Desmospora profundinema]